MKYQLPWVSRRQYQRVLAAERAETLRVKKVKDEWWQRHDRIAEELAAVSIVNACLTEDLTKAREQLAASMAAESALAMQIHEMAQPVEPTDDELDTLNRLIRERDSEKVRADRLQKQYDDAAGLTALRGDIGLTDSEHWKPPISLDVRPKGAAS